MSQQLDDLKKQTSDLVDALIDAINDGPPSPNLNKLLDKALLELQKLNNTILQDSQAAIIAGLSAQNEALGDLNKEIDDFSKKLDATAKKLKAIADKVGIVVGVVAGIVSSGVL